MLLRFIHGADGNTFSYSLQITNGDDILFPIAFAFAIAIAIEYSDYDYETDWDKIK